MTDSRDVSVFDIIGPVMVGPSSSHTAGAVRIGQITRAILGRQPEKALIELHGSFAETGTGHGTDKALVAGLLGLTTADERIRDSFTLAAQAGLDVTIQTVDLGEEAHPNSARLTLWAEEETICVQGSSVGGGMVEISNVQGYAVSFSGEYDTLLVIADDQPGTINAVTGWLLNQGINVAFLKVDRQTRGGEAIMVIETDQNIPEAMLNELEAFPWVHWVRDINKIGE